jgi:dephospho-CoA kinase
VRRGLSVSRDTLTPVANDLARLHGPDYIARELYKRAKERGGDAVIESLRRPGEIAALRALGSFVLFAVDADPRIRYERIVERGSETDAVSFEKFLFDEKRESVSDNPNVQNLPKCIALADVLLTNNGTFDDLYRQIDKAL